MAALPCASKPLGDKATQEWQAGLFSQMSRVISHLATDRESLRSENSPGASSFRLLHLVMVKNTGMRYLLLQDL